MNPEIDEFISNAEKWPEEIEQLRMIGLDCGLTEALKWGKPCYSFSRESRQESNIVIIQPFKESCALMFFKGGLLEDPHGVLEKPGKNSRVARRIPFTSPQQIIEMEPILKTYIREAIEAEKADWSQRDPFGEVDAEPIPEELRKKLDEKPTFKTAFDALTRGRQRGYILYFSDAKQSKTRKRRVEKYMDKILNGKGLHDR